MKLYIKEQCLFEDEWTKCMFAKKNGRYCENERTIGKYCTRHAPIRFKEYEK